MTAKEDAAEEEFQSAVENIGINRRRSARNSFLVVEIKGKHANKVFLASAENLGKGGAFLPGRQDFKVGDLFPIEFVLPDNKTTVSCMSEVVWKKKYEKDGLQAAEGIGIKFLDMAPEQEKVIGKWVDKEEKKECIQ